MLSSSDSAPRIDAKCLSILTDFLFSEGTLFPKAPHIVAEQVAKSAVVHTVASKLLTCKAEDFFFHDKVHSLMSYMAGCEKELVRAERKLVEEFVARMECEAKTNVKFAEAAIEQVQQFGKLLEALK